MGLIKKLVRKLTKWAWSDEVQFVDGVSTLSKLIVDEKSIVAEIKTRPEIAQFQAHCFANLLLNSPNYTELKFDIQNPKEKYKWITVLVQKGEGKTPHQLRVEAKNKLKKYEP